MASGVEETEVATGAADTAGAATTKHEREREEKIRLVRKMVERSRKAPSIKFAKAQQQMRADTPLRVLMAMGKQDLAVLLLAFAHDDAESFGTVLKRCLAELGNVEMHRRQNELVRQRHQLFGAIFFLHRPSFVGSARH